MNSKGEIRERNNICFIRYIYDIDNPSINYLLQNELENLPLQIEEYYTSKKKSFLSKLAK